MSCPVLQLHFRPSEEPSDLAASASSFPPPSFTLTGDFCPTLGEKKKKNCSLKHHLELPVPRTSCLFPGHTWCFPTQASAHILSSLWNRLLTILPSNRMLIYRLISYVTSSRKPLLLLPIRCYLRFFDHSQYLSCTFLMACSSSAFSCC